MDISTQTDLNFNPTLVQLEEGAVIQEGAVIKEFQSHIGAIRSSRNAGKGVKIL